MISLSSIRTYMFCPLKLYFQHNLDEINDDFLLNKTIKQLRIDLQDLFQRNIRRITKEMELSEIENTLNKNIEEYIKNSLNILEKSFNEEINNIKTKNTNNEEIKKIDILKEEINDETKFNIKLLALKSQKAMKATEKDGEEIAELFFPTSMYSYLIRDSQLEIIGSADKIEIINGKYFPIDIRSTSPPLKGVWDTDAVKLVGTALLIEQEFDTDVFVGFIEYTKIGDRRPVVMDANLRKNLFKVVSEIKEIINEGLLPDVNINLQKCDNCNYNEICNQNQE